MSQHIFAPNWMSQNVPGSVGKRHAILFEFLFNSIVLLCNINKLFLFFNFLLFKKKTNLFQSIF